MAITRSGLKPDGTLNKSQKLRSRSPAATMSTRESANSLTTRTWRARERPGAPVEPLRKKPQQETLGTEENGKTSNSAKQEEQQALGQKLADEARSLRSQGLSN